MKSPQVCIRENEELKSSLQKVESQLALIETDAKQTSVSKEAIQTKLKEETDRYEQFKQELESGLEYANQEITKLRRDNESYKSELAQNSTKHFEEFENIKSILRETEQEKQEQLIENEKLASIVAKAEEATQAKLKEETDRFQQSKQDFESEIESAKQEISELQQNAESSNRNGLKTLPSMLRRSRVLNLA